MEKRSTHLDVGFARVVVRSTHDRARSFFVARVVQRAPLHAFVTRHASRRRGRARQPRAHASSGSWSCCSPEDTSRSSPLVRHEVQGGADAPQGLRAPHQGVQRGTRRPPAARRSPRSRGIVRTARSGPDESAPRVLTGRFPRDFGRLRNFSAAPRRSARAKEKASDALALHSHIPASRS